MKQSILDLIGEPAALEQLAEEAAELAQAALKLARVLRDENPTPVTEDKARKAVTEEYTDVILCASMTEGMVKPDPLLLKEKLTRWEDRLKVKAEKKGYSEKQSELNPCPFCGGEAKINYWEFGAPAIIQCHDCHVNFIFPWYQAETTLDLAGAWNRRADNGTADRMD